MPFVKLSAVVIDTDTIVRFRPLYIEGRHINTHALRIVVRDGGGDDALDYKYSSKEDRDADFSLLVDALVTQRGEINE
jgi:hypothetical protein